VPSTHSCLSAFAIIVCLSAFSAVSAFAQNDSNGEVRDYGDVWKVVIRADSARLVYRVNLETTQLTVIDRAR